MTSVYMSGTVTVPQSCQLAPGQNAVMNFGAINKDQLARPGEAPEKVIKRTFQIKCSNISQTVKINLSLESQPHSQEPSLLATQGRSDLGIQVRNLGRVVWPLVPFGTPKPNNIIPLDLNYAAQTTEFELEAWPVKMTSDPKVGPFNATATLKFDFE